MGQASSSKTRVYHCSISVKDDDVTLCITGSKEPIINVKVTRSLFDKHLRDHEEWHMYEVMIKDGTAIDIKRIYPLF